ncbi:MAG: iron-sulfur cluster insertion protein ErpA [Legionellales bacterium]|nr:iron-sulfur cluster insertion protein ErpA [Legionellales bacterium]
MSSTNEESLVIFTENAANKVLELIQEEQEQDLNLRVSISGGGCSGFQYGFAFDENINKDDYIVETQARFDDKQDLVKLLIDPISLQYLEGSQVDYEKNFQGEQFIVKNPNANTTCGCGNSFSI